MSQANETALAAVKTWLRETGNDAFAVFSGDEHGSEYTVAHDRLRAYLSGFTGSADTLTTLKFSLSLARKAVLSSPFKSFTTRL